jgi:ribosome-associated toxin RatA of RatAB toxin-antitoxin module
MLLGFGILRRRIRSIGVLSPPRRIDITSGDAPFRHFNLCWTFERLAATETLVELSADFELRFKLWQRLLAASFPLEVAAMADSFERRARQVYRDG